MTTLLQSNPRACPSCESTTVEFQRPMGNDNLYVCIACGASYAEHVPSAELLKKTYEQLYAQNGGYHLHRKEADRIRKMPEGGAALKVGWERRRFFSKVQSNGGDSLLDVGCGTGLFMVAAKMRGWKVTGVELSREAAELGVAAHKLPVHIGRIESADLQGQRFAAITAWEVLEHLPYPREFLKTVIGMLSCGGVFAGSVPNYARPRYRHGQSLGPSSVPPVHLNFWTPQSLENTLRSAGFAQVEVHAPVFCPDLLRPFRSLRWNKIVRFLNVLLGKDTPTEMFFLARQNR